MALSPGRTLGRCEAVSRFGNVGTGEACRARDTKLNREVAVKVLPRALANNPGYFTLFQREAQRMASHNGSNIAINYGLAPGEIHRVPRIAARNVVQTFALPLLETKGLASCLPAKCEGRVSVRQRLSFLHSVRVVQRRLPCYAAPLSPGKS